jgi:hypothetical protein
MVNLPLYKELLICNISVQLIAENIVFVKGWIQGRTNEAVASETLLTAQHQHCLLSGSGHSYCHKNTKNTSVYYFFS